MKENNIINEALEIMDSSIKEAYDFLVGKQSFIEDKTGQIYNFLYCLAALCELEEEALKWLEIAIIEEKLWYRPEVFEDEDLDLIRDSLRFQKCVSLSNFRYESVLKKAKSVCTWSEKTSDHLLLVLHGNQQNNDITRSYWTSLEGDYQVEYLQSSELDSKDLYRWEIDGNGYKELLKALGEIEVNKYETVSLAGFSAGCQVILKALTKGFYVCSKVILVAPWIPEVEKNAEYTVKLLASHHVELEVLCGTKDEDCLPFAKILVEEAKAHDLDVRYKWMNGLNHEYPDELNEVLKSLKEESYK